MRILGSFSFFCYTIRQLRGRFLVKRSMEPISILIRGNEKNKNEIEQNSERKK